MQLNNKSAIFFAYMKGSLVGTIVLILSVLISAAVLYKGKIEQSMYFPLLLLCLAISGTVSGFSGAKKIRKNGLLTGLISSALPAVISTSATAVASRQLGLYPMISAVIILLFGAVGGIAALNIKTNKKRKNKVKK